MYHIIQKGTEYEIFSESTINSMYATISKELTSFLKQNKNPKPVLLGAFALHNVPLKDGNIKNVWIEYNANILPLGLIDAGIHQCIIYDEIPDVILDKYNDIKKIIF